MKSKLLIILTILCCLSNINAQNDHLEPVESVFDDLSYQYYTTVRKILFKGMSYRPEVRFVIIPSFSVEQVVAIEKSDDKYFIVHHKMEQSIWYTEEDPEKINVIKKKVEIPKKLAKLYKELFLIAINNRKYPEVEIWGNDGTNYYFTVYDSRLKTGMIWSPRPKSKMKRLEKIGYSLINLAYDTKKGAIARPNKKLINEIKALTNELRSNK
ncbi:hypothetical protein [Tenacibaculum amylolyticum]|uniref:hypothetical protein n=1 Tax=Tenacibaculum amylolyticum TaxID=104269 RepID=UPI0038952F74